MQQGIYPASYDPAFAARALGGSYDAHAASAAAMMSMYAQQRGMEAAAAAAAATGMGGAEAAASGSGREGAEPVSEEESPFPVRSRKSVLAPCHGVESRT